MRRFKFGLAVIALVFATMPVAGADGPPLDVEFVVDTVFATGTGDFTATGPAVAAGVMCSDGVAYDQGDPAISGGQSAHGSVNIQVFKEFVCGDRFSLADVLLFTFLEFGASVGQPLNADNRNIAAWYERVGARASASA